LRVSPLRKHGSPAFRLIYTGLSQCGARPGELCRAQISDVDWEKGRITLAEHKTARKTGKPRVIPIGKNFGQTLQKAIGDRQSGAIPCGIPSEGRATLGFNATAVVSRL
jgi:integrase